MDNDRPTSTRKTKLDDSQDTKDTTEGSNFSEVEEKEIESVTSLFSHTMTLTNKSVDTARHQKIIPDLTFEGLCDHWRNGHIKNIITMVGAGISTSAGIPDFRSPGSGLYDNLQKYHLPHASAIFDLAYFKKNPQPFFDLARELYPGNFNPTPSHYFIRLLHEKGLLLRHYTQNIDTLDRLAGIPDEKMVEAHGTFYTNHCIHCRQVYSMKWMKNSIFSNSHVPRCTECNGVVKPDIIFFGENLPQKFYTMPHDDFKKCDLLIIMGTSLEVQPFASLLDYAEPNCLRLLINRTKIRSTISGSLFAKWYHSSCGLMIDHPQNTRDIAYIGDCDEGIFELSKALGWTDDLKKILKTNI